MRNASDTARVETVKKFTSAGIFIFSVFVFFSAPFIGGQDFAFKDIFADGTASEIFWKIRLPRVITSFIAGSMLSAGGLVFQAMFKNPIATPFTLGVSSGASLGTAVYFFFGFSVSVPGFFGDSLFALCGAVATIFIVYGAASLIGGKNDSGILLIGVAMNFLCSGIIMFIQYSVDSVSSHVIMHYMIGSISGVGIKDALYIFPAALIGCSVIMLLRRELDLISMGEETASARGVNTSAVTAVLYFVVSAMIACAAAICGPIGFVGMMAPHICRLMTGASNIRLALLAIIFGGAFLTLCDTAARTIFSPIEMPVGIITSMLGAPFFIFLIIKRKRA